MGGSVEVVYVDPVAGRREAVAEALELAEGGLAVRSVASAAAAERSIETRPADAVVARSDLSDADGASFLRRIAAQHPDAVTVLYAEDADALVEATGDPDVGDCVRDAGDDQARVLARLVVERCAGRRAERSRVDTLADAVSDVFLTADAEGVVRYVNPAVEDVLGYAPEEIVGEPLTTLAPARLHEDQRRGFRRYVETGERTEEWNSFECPGRHADGREVQLDVSYAEFRVDGERRFAGVVRDVTERHRREAQLPRLNQLARSLTAAETEEEVAETAVEAAAETLDLPFAAVELYDEERAGLGRVAESPAVASLGGGPLFDGQREVSWRVFVESSGETFDDLRGASRPESGLAVGGAVVLPVGRYGAFVAGTPATDALSETDVLLAQALAANVRAALERVERERTLRERNEELERRTETLERVERISAVSRDLTRALTRASTREEIERAVCTRLARVDSYRFAWIGSPETVGGKLEPRASAGVGDGYLDAVTVTTDESETGQGPAGRAARTREPAVQNDLHADPPFEPWRAEALRRGYRSCLSVPVVHRDTLYGVVTIYADRPAAFDDMEVGALGELGRTIGYAIDALERERAPVSDRAIELEFEIGDGDVPAVGFADETNGRVEFDALIERSDGSLRAYVTVTGCDPEAVREWVARDPTVDGLVHVGQKDDGHLFEVTVGRTGLLGTLVEKGAHPTRLDVTPEGSTVTVELPGSADVSGFVDAFLGTHEGAELLARRELDRPVRAESEFRALYLDRLTERQMEVVETAYFAGFFEWPRRATGGEVADLLGVSQPTVNRHIRNGERKLFGMVFEGDGAD